MEFPCCRVRRNSHSGKVKPEENLPRTLLKLRVVGGNVTPDLVLIMVKLTSVGQGSAKDRDLFLAALDWLRRNQQIMPTESWTALNQEGLSSPCEDAKSDGDESDEDLSCNQL